MMMMVYRLFMIYMIVHIKMMLMILMIRKDGNCNVTFFKKATGIYIAS